MKRRPQLNPTLRTYSPPAVAAMPLAEPDADERKGGWMKNITRALLDAMRFGPTPKCAPPPSDDGQDPRLLRSGLRQVASSDCGPRADRHGGANQWRG